VFSSDVSNVIPRCLNQSVIRKGNVTERLVLQSRQCWPSIGHTVMTVHH